MVRRRGQKVQFHQAFAVKDQRVVMIPGMDGITDTLPVFIKNRSAVKLLTASGVFTTNFCITHERRRTVNHGSVGIARQLVIIFLAQHTGETAFFGNSRSVTGSLSLKICAVTAFVNVQAAGHQTFRRDAAYIDTGTAVHLVIFFNQLISWY